MIVLQTHFLRICDKDIVEESMKIRIIYESNFKPKYIKAVSNNKTYLKN